MWSTVVREGMAVEFRRLAFMYVAGLYVEEEGAPESERYANEG